MRRFVPLFLALPLLACGDDDDAGGGSSNFPTASAEQAISNYKQLVNNNYADVLTTATALKTAIAAFVATPTEATQKAAQDAWIAARVPYGPSEAFRFYDGPIDNPDNGPEGLINSWPLDENYIDYTREDPAAGIVNDPKDELTATMLTNLNAAMGEAEISTGYHAIEFLLWGQDDATVGTGAGKRSFTDYTTAQNADRRKQYLTVVTDLLLTNLQQVADPWKPGADYATKFGVSATEAGANPQQEAISDLLKSIGSMAKAELSGERMTVAYKDHDQEDEHSCFSDNTSADLLGNGTGIQNVWLGKYGALDGVGVQDVVAAVDPALATKTTTDLETAVAKLKALADLQAAGTPFDVVISTDTAPGHSTMLEAIQALKVVGADVESAAGKLGLKIQLEDPSETL